MNKILVQWSEKEPAKELSNLDELDRLLDDIASSTPSEHPSIVFIYAYGYQVGIGIGHDRSFLHFELETGEGPYVITVGNVDEQRVLAFYLLGNHHTEIRQRNLVPVAQAREALRKWIQTGIRSAEMKWEEV
jgi:hypothetical protein